MASTNNVEFLHSLQHKAPPSKCRFRPTEKLRAICYSNFTCHLTEATFCCYGRAEDGTQLIDPKVWKAELARACWCTYLARGYCYYPMLISAPLRLFIRCLKRKASTNLSSPRWTAWWADLCQVCTRLYLNRYRQPRDHHPRTVTKDHRRRSQVNICFIGNINITQLAIFLSQLTAFLKTQKSALLWAIITQMAFRSICIFSKTVTLPRGSYKWQVKIAVIYL